MILDRLAMVAVSAAIIAAGCSGGDDESRAAAPADFPDVVLTAADASTTSSDEWVGEPIVINFWYSTCPPCARELADFAEVHDERGDDVRFIGVNPLDDLETMETFAAERGVTYELYRDDAAELQIELEVTSFPATLFVDSTGRGVEQTAVLSADDLRSEIDDLLGADEDGSPASGETTEFADEPSGAARTPDWNGIRRDPPPPMSTETLPSMTTPGENVSFTPEDGRLQVVYFGFTSCPDVCPTTMSDLSVALRRLGDDADRVDGTLVSVDPDRDRDNIAAYVEAFVPSGVAALSDDEELLERVAEPFGASWEVRTLDDGTVEVDHTAFLYVVDHTGRLALTWPFGLSADLIAADLERLLDSSAPEA